MISEAGREQTNGQYGGQERLQDREGQLELGQSTEESGEAGLGTQIHGKVWAFGPCVIRHWESDVISFLLWGDHT